MKGEVFVCSSSELFGIGGVRDVGIYGESTDVTDFLKGILTLC